MSRNSTTSCLVEGQLCIRCLTVSGWAPHHRQVSVVDSFQFLRFMFRHACPVSIPTRTLHSLRFLLSSWLVRIFSNPIMFCLAKLHLPSWARQRSSACFLIACSIACFSESAGVESSTSTSWLKRLRNARSWENRCQDACCVLMRQMLILPTLSLLIVFIQSLMDLLLVSGWLRALNASEFSIRIHICCLDSSVSLLVASSQQS